MTRIHLPLSRLRAEPMVPSHFAALREMHQDAAMMAQIGGVRTPSESLAYLDRHLAHWAEYGFGFWILFNPGDHRAIGLAGLRTLQLDEGPEVELGYGFLPEAWGRGFATETARACLAYGAHQLRLTTMVAITAPDYAASARVLTKAGLRFDRVLERDGTRSDLFRTTPEAMTAALSPDAGA